MMAGTILENLKMVNRESTDEQIKEVLEIACISEFVEKLPGGIMYEIGQGGQGISEGQSQRLAIARALLKDAPILLMDEATSALDVATERRVLDNIKKRYPDKTIILTSHRPTVLTMCDRVYRIEDKKIDVVGQEDIQKLMDEF
jgi:ABC-type bacteriocin/lantibiotic exporter with double-glycine peptidase domain